MIFNVTRDKYESTGEFVWRLEINDHNFFDFPSDYTVIIECRTKEGLLKNVAHYINKFTYELDTKNKTKKNRK